jgi:hypothetical protein
VPTFIPYIALTIHPQKSLLVILIRIVLLLKLLGFAMATAYDKPFELRWGIIGEFDAVCIRHAYIFEAGLLNRSIKGLVSLHHGS